jgi:transposase
MVGEIISEWVGEIKSERWAKSFRNGGRFRGESALEEKHRIVAESDSGARQVSATARRYGLSTGQLFTWRRLSRKGRLGGDAEPMSFAEAVIADRGSATAAPPPPAGACRGMEIVLADGLRVIVEQGVDPRALACLIGALERR